MPLHKDAIIYRDPVHMPFSECENAIIGVEATAYLQTIMEENPEPLLAALGGSPLVLRKEVVAELEKWKGNNMTPYFVFEGIPVVGQQDVTLRRAKKALSNTQEAWALYSANKPNDAVTAFGNAGAISIRDLYPILQDLLSERGLDFMVAPFSACAQLAAMDSADESFIDGIMGSQELLLYNINNAVIFPPISVNWEIREFFGVEKNNIIKRHNITPSELLTDALLMTGTSFLSQFPQASTVSGSAASSPWSILDAYNGLRAHNKSVMSFAAHYSDKIQESDPSWLAKYQKAKMAVDHCITLSPEGKLHIKDFGELTIDNQTYVGVRLPEELHYYSSQGLIGPRILASMIWNENVILPTLDGLQSDEYIRLLADSLMPTREDATSLVMSRCAHSFQFFSQTLKFWFEDKPGRKIEYKSREAEVVRKTVSWGVKEADIRSLTDLPTTRSGTLSFAALSLQQKGFTATSVSTSPTNALETTEEILSNALWRLLHVRGYVNDQHELSTWGKALATTLKAIGSTVAKFNDAHHLEEAAFLAFELLQFDVLNTRNQHPELIGSPLRGSDEQKSSCMLVSRTACLLKVRHKSVGYTGPLSKNLLSFYSLIKAVRATDRELLEAIVVNMLLGAHAKRKDTEFRPLAQKLPFLEDINITMGIAVKTYLDDALKDITSPAERAAAKAAYGSKYLPHGVDIEEDLNVAFDFFDALYAGIKILGSELSETDRKAWDDAKTYLDERR